MPCMDSGCPPRAARRGRSPRRSPRRGCPRAEFAHDARELAVKAPDQRSLERVLALVLLPIAVRVRHAAPPRLCGRTVAAHAADREHVGAPSVVRTITSATEPHAQHLDAGDGQQHAEVSSGRVPTGWPRNHSTLRYDSTSMPTPRQQRAGYAEEVQRPGAVARDQQHRRQIEQPSKKRPSRTCCGRSAARGAAPSALRRGSRGRARTPARSGGSRRTRAARARTRRGTP